MAGAEDHRLTDYLLGKLPDEKMAEIEDRAFADRAYLLSVQAAEADLIDAYVRGELHGTELRAFEQRFLVSAGRRRKIEFARTLARVAGEEAVPAVPPEPFWSRWLHWDRPMQFAAAMAALACVVALPWLGYENRAMRTRMAELESRSGELERQTGDLNRQLAEEKARAAQVKQVSPQSLIASIALMAGSRSSNAAPRLQLSADTQLARIEIQLEPQDDFPRYRVELRTAAGVEILTRGSLTAQRVAAVSSVVLDLPSSALAPGRYELALKGIAPDNSAKEVGYYGFTVRR
ncbi:MAG: hypothetical protein U0Q16_34610 [Bryobacteraceae bacterium]